MFRNICVCSNLNVPYYFDNSDSGSVIEKENESYWFKVTIYLKVKICNLFYAFRQQKKAFQQ